MLAFTFPGQGSQRPGMGAPWQGAPSWELVGEASEVAGRDVARLLLDADAEELRATRNAQLTTFVLSLVVLDAVERLGIAPAVCAGHSLGEYTALTATGAVSFADGVALVHARGEAMQAAADLRPGTMAALLGLDDDAADAACRRADSDVWVANFNAPGQVVIAGAPEGVEAAGRAAKELGGRKVLPLPVGGAFHTPFMAPARDDLRTALAKVDFRAPDVPVVANVDARAHPEPDGWASLLSAQLVSPVRWHQSVLRMVADGAAALVELGPGGVLTGMARRITSDARGLSVAAPADIEALVELLAGEPPDPGGPPAGEQTAITERLVVSPAAGSFAPAERYLDGADGQAVEVGDVVGTVSGQEVRTPFAGRLMGLLALAGERVTPSQPVAWLRTA